MAEYSDSDVVIKTNPEREFDPPNPCDDGTEK